MIIVVLDGTPFIELTPNCCVALAASPLFGTPEEISTSDFTHFYPRIASYCQTIMSGLGTLLVHADDELAGVAVAPPISVTTSQHHQ